MKKLFIISILSVFITASLFCQEALKSTEEEYYDFLSLIGITQRPTLGYRTLSDSVWTLDKDSDHIWYGNNLGTTYTLWQPDSASDNWFTKGLKQSVTLRAYGPEWFNSYNSASPYGQNDGALWQGHGYNTSFTGGLRLEGFGFEATFKPQISFSQNLDFEYLPGIYGDTHSYNWGGNVDLVQRYGDTPFWNYDWGDSEIRWTWHSLTFGFGNQSPWIGPAYLNPMLGSNNAATYTKFDAGLRKTSVYLPWNDYYLGDIEGRIWTGKLLESNYFDNNDTNNERMLNALSASYSPSFIPGLTVGANRVIMSKWTKENFRNILKLVWLGYSNGTDTGNDEDQKISITGEWDFPKVGFTVYGEFGRDDFSYSELCNPFHTAIYTLGFKQNIPVKKNKSELIIEFSNFEMSQDYQLQYEYLGFYSHGFLTQGYTNKGQILGAGSGYFGNSQYIEYKIYFPDKLLSFKFHRHNPNNNSIYSKAVNASANNGYSELTSKWYHNFETVYNFSVQFLLILNQNIFIDQEFTVNDTYKPMYQQTASFPNDNRLNINYTIQLKWSL